MLEIRPTCENCNCALPNDSTDAMICTFECTYCKDCVENVLHNVCPNCGGGFTPRPIRPLIDRRTGTSLAFQPASTVRVNAGYSRDEIRLFAAAIKDIAPADR